MNIDNLDDEQLDHAGMDAVSGIVLMIMHLKALNHPEVQVPKLDHDAIKRAANIAIANVAILCNAVAPGMVEATPKRTGRG